MSIQISFRKGLPYKTALRCLSSTANIKPVDLASTTYENSNLGATKAPFVIAHGLFGSKSNWASLCKHYSQKIGKVIALDLRNHGESVHANEHTYYHLVEDVRHFLLKNGIDKIRLMGHSMGGRCAMLFALTYPEMLEKLIIVDISPSTASPQLIELPKMINAMQSVIMPENVSLTKARAIVDQQLAKTFSSKDVRSFILTNLIAKKNSYKWRLNVPVLEQSFNNIATFPELNSATYNGATLFIGGGISDFLPKSDFPKIQKLFPKAELKYIEGAGHWVHAEKPNEFLKLTLDFLNKP
ncbi:unnamed protein product [Ceutorhynchus assimilis]|uniref:sn-1-specific diacylglycerol lipase ABHD11 n=1 Tax=Ceutorhynchus assimilis TaxID=467358 RepID=A0A9N9QL25_9CUCU|nr:unnamed protein product [Ceutorhynchus assimilis]